MTKDEEGRQNERGARKKKLRSPAAERAISVASSHSRVDKDSGSGRHGPGSSSSRTRIRANAEKSSHPGDVSASPTRQRVGDQPVGSIGSGVKVMIRLSDPSDSHDSRRSLNPSFGAGVSEFSGYSLVDLISSSRLDSSPDKACVLAPVSPDRESTLGHKPGHSVQSVIPDILVNLYSRKNLDTRMNPDSRANLYNRINPYVLVNPDSWIIPDTMGVPNSCLVPDSCVLSDAIQFPDSLSFWLFRLMQFNQLWILWPLVSYRLILRLFRHTHSMCMMILMNKFRHLKTDLIVLDLNQWLPDTVLSLTSHINLVALNVRELVRTLVLRDLDHIWESAAGLPLLVHDILLLILDLGHGLRVEVAQDIVAVDIFGLITDQDTLFLDLITDRISIIHLDRQNLDFIRGDIRLHLLPRQITGRSHLRTQRVG